MKEFKINEQQVQLIATVLLELPAKNVIQSIDLLRSLPLLNQSEDDVIR